MSRRELYSLSKANKVFSQPRSATVILLMVLILPLIKIWVYLWYQHFKIQLESLQMFSDWSDLFGSTRWWYDLRALYFLFQTCSPFLSCIPVQQWALPVVSPLPHVVSFTHTLEYPVQWSYSQTTLSDLWSCYGGFCSYMLKRPLTCCLLWVVQSHPFVHLLCLLWISARV